MPVSLTIVKSCEVTSELQRDAYRVSSRGCETAFRLQDESRAQSSEQSKAVIEPQADDKRLVVIYW